MAIELMLKRTASGIEPASRFDGVLIADWPIGEVRKAKVTKPRSLPVHNKWFALLHVVFPHQETWVDAVRFRKAIQRALGFVEEENGHSFDVSIAFENMDGEEFNALYERTVELILTRILPNVGREDLNRQVDEILAGRTAA